MNVSKKPPSGYRLVGNRNESNLIKGYSTNEWIIGGYVRDVMYGMSGMDRIKGIDGDDILLGDSVTTSSLFNAEGNVAVTRNLDDKLHGGDGNDFLIDQFGSDLFSGGSGDDVLLSVSDAGMPAENSLIPSQVDDGDDLEKLSFNSVFTNPSNLDANDVLRGGHGADKFLFELLINAPKEIVQRHTELNSGIVKWGMGGVAGENNNYHDHWVESIGNDKILDFSSSEGDQIIISGHTVKAKLLSNNTNKGLALIGLFSDQGSDGQRGNGAHDFDSLGTIKVRYKDEFVFDDHVIISSEDHGSYGPSSNSVTRHDLIIESFADSVPPKIIGTSNDDKIKGNFIDNKIKGLEGDDFIVGGFGGDRLLGGSGEDYLMGDKLPFSENYDGKGYVILPLSFTFNDRILGGDGHDILVDQYGADRFKGGGGDDRLISISDSGVPKQNLKIIPNLDDGSDLDKLKFSKKFYDAQGLKGRDILTGGLGSDVFEWNLLINASKDIVARHTDQSSGKIDWGMNGVAGENDNYHDHWVDGIGRDVITDFSGIGGEGDQIVVRGHTVNLKLLKDTETISVIGVYSDQGGDGVRGAGAHDFDVLGSIAVRHDGNFNFDTDVHLESHDFGAYGNGAGLNEVFALI